MIFIQLTNNVALLLALSILYSFISRKWSGGEILGRIIAGLLFGGVLIAGMMNPMHFSPGVILGLQYFCDL